MISLPNPSKMTYSEEVQTKIDELKAENYNENTYEVAFFRPDGTMSDGISGWNNKQEVSAMMWVLSQL